MDELVGAVVETLHDIGAMDSTYIFFSSDHGFHFHNLRLGVGKWCASPLACRLNV